MNLPKNDWDKYFTNNKELLNTLEDILDKEIYYPVKQDIFKAFHLCNLENLKVLKS